ncbi:hypothetical protein [Novosphingobium aquimarinum]|uniref:hypothetical protein n=1 Tax=Novosphingobium aquimarinum TaxID=2682494 RepID=UPI0012EB81C8|nr:hypothetical protein [Novosphingobium aquimarinum]
MTDGLEARIATALARPVDPKVAAFATQLGVAQDALATVFYGSNLRTGSLEGVLDFYVLLPGPVERGIWPRVSYHEHDIDGVTLRAKVATMTLQTFAAAAAGETIDTTIWTRFVQPSALVYARTPSARQAVTAAVCAAAQTGARVAVALGAPSASPEEYWRTLFRATYAAEFRVEKAGREDSILAVNREHFDGLLPLALIAQGIDFARGAQGTLTPRLDPERRQRLLRWWHRRRRAGRPYNLARLVKASTTFEGAARYAAWKIERHTGVAVPLTPWRERHPMLAAPGVLWKLWRAKRSRA